MRKYLISVVVPIYNTEQYLEETLESIINQTIGFKENIQLLLVNNATKDNSEEICLKYIKRYPDNVEYIKVNENHGPCSARNAGLARAFGKYITFLDSDDKWEPTAFKKMVEFFDTHYDEMDFVAARIQHFDAYDDFDLFDYKFKNGNQVVDIFDNPSYVQFSLCSVLIKFDVAKRYVHDERIRHAEDMKYLTEILFEKGKYGIVPKALFYYRMRLSKNSTLDTTAYSDNWYKETVEYSYFYLMKLSKEKYGRVIPYLQYILLSEVRGRLEKDIPEKYDSDFIRRYKNRIKRILCSIEDELIIHEPHLYTERKMYALSLKYGRQFSSLVRESDKRYEFNNITISDLREITYLRSVVAMEDMGIITGFVRGCRGLRLILEITNSIGEKVVLNKTPLKDVNDIYCLNKRVCTGEAFRIVIPLLEGEKLSFNVSVNGNKIPQKLKMLEEHTINNHVFTLRSNTIYVSGMNKNIFPSYYLFPFEKVDKGASVIIYGAGYIGQQYVEQTNISNYCKVASIVDNNYKSKPHIKGIKIIPPREIQEVSFDYIVVAVGTREVASEIYNDLIAMGVPKKKIVLELRRLIPWA